LQWSVSATPVDFAWLETHATSPAVEKLWISSVLIQVPALIFPAMLCLVLPEQIKIYTTCSAPI